ncbi:unnamed protein product [Urochloa decumbens]|uniref:F-box domain-containing protein n=1 Tax=Urochloa decumbens TaxID=240449 RepID=A0ABC8W8M8_9POAL
MEVDDGTPPLAVAAANYGVLPVDVLYDVLLRLPAKELCRLRLVCRSWRSLTSDPLFAKAHSRRHPPHAVVLSYESNEVQVVDLHGHFVKRIPIGQQLSAMVLTTQGDLACVSHGWGLAYVLSLATGAVIADTGIESRSKVNAEKPMCVLGRVPSTGEYKLLRIQSHTRSYNNRCVVTTSQTCEVMTLGRRWRKRPRPPALLSCWSVAVVIAGLAYFLTNAEEVAEQPDSIAVFDMATEKWKPTTIQGPLSSSNIILSASSGEEVVVYPTIVLRKQFRLARLNERLVTLYCNLEECATELWILVDMEESLWTKLYTLQGTQLEDKFYLHYRYHYPLVILDDGKIVIWVARTGSLRAYDPRTSTWADLATVSGAVVMHHGSLLCPNLGVE